MILLERRQISASVVRIMNVLVFGCVCDVRQFVFYFAKKNDKNCLVKFHQSLEQKNVLFQANKRKRDNESTCVSFHDSKSWKGFKCLAVSCARFDRKIRRMHAEDRSESYFIEVLLSIKFLRQ